MHEHGFSGGAPDDCRGGGRAGCQPGVRRAEDARGPSRRGAGAQQTRIPHPAQNGCISGGIEIIAGATRRIRLRADVTRGRGQMIRILVRIAVAVVVLTLTAGAVAVGQTQDRRVRELLLLAQPQAADPQESEMARLLAPEFEKLGFKVTVKVMPWEQQSDCVWYSREKWDMTMWRMVGRAERSDPDEFTFNLFHASTADKGYNFVGYTNQTYNGIAEAQRIKTDLKARRLLIFEAQKIIARDAPYVFLVFPQSSYAYNNTVWDPKSIGEQKGIGLKNFGTFHSATPNGTQKDIVLNTADPVLAINPLYISGATDSWITELIWDRLLPVRRDGLPKPWAAEKDQWGDTVTPDVNLRAGIKRPA